MLHLLRIIATTLISVMEKQCFFVGFGDERDHDRLANDAWIFDAFLSADEVMVLKKSTNI